METKFTKDSIINFFDWLEDNKEITLTEGGLWPRGSFGSTYKSQIGELLNEWLEENFNEPNN